MIFCSNIRTKRIELRKFSHITLHFVLNQPSSVLRALVTTLRAEGDTAEEKKKNIGREVNKGVLEKTGWELRWWWGGERSKVSPPLVISPEPERQSRPGQRRFRCQRETTDWRVQAGPLLRTVLVGPFILPSLPSLLRPIPPLLQPHYPLCSPHFRSTHRNQSLSSTRPPPRTPNSPLFSPLKLNSTTAFHSASRAGWGCPLWGWMSSVHHHVLTQLTFTQKHTHVEHIFMQIIST